MAQISEADKYLLDLVRAGSPEGWSELVGRYEGRLLAFARGRMGAEAEDLVQETFISFLKGVREFRGEASLETFLFTILRRKVVDFFRGRKARLSLCRIQEGAVDGESGLSVVETLASPDPSASWYVRRAEDHASSKAALTGAIRGIIDKLKETQNFRDLQIIEMIFYCRLRNKEIAGMMGLNEFQISGLKHRILESLREEMKRAFGSREAGPEAFSDSLLSDIWQEQRLSCLKRSTIGSFLLGSLEEPWREYAAFHLERLGCSYCLSNLADLEKQSSAQASGVFRNRILQSTVGFLSRNC
jgi:RNA polymerase sigma factor (sigma-70 family)